jgi:hypothetical protein
MWSILEYLEESAILKDKMEVLENCTPALTNEYLLGTQARERNTNVSI